MYINGMKAKPLLALFLVCGLWACKKDPVQQPVEHTFPQPPLPLVSKKTVTANGNVTVTSFRYDTVSWLLKSRQDQYGIYVYEYGNANYISYGNTSLSLNTEGLVASDNGFYHPFQYWYNADSTLHEQYMYMSSRKTYTYYPDGNMASVTATLPDHASSMQGPAVTSYFYPNHIANTLGNRNYGMPYFGKSSPNLPDSAFYFMVYSGDTISFTLSYSYQFDSLARVISETGIRHQLDSLQQPMDTTISYSTYEYY